MSSSHASLALAGLLLIFVSTASCAEEPDVAAVGPTSVRDLPPPRVVGPYVHAGVALPLRIDGDIDTEYAQRGAVFTARTEAPMRADDGSVVVPEGALVRAHIVSTGTAEAPRVRIAFDSVETVQGPARIAAQIEHAQHTAHPGPLTPVPPESARVFVDEYVYPVDFTQYGSGEWPTNNTFQGAQSLYFPREIHIPEGSRMTVVLTRPILPPGTRVVAAR